MHKYSKLLEAGELYSQILKHQSNHFGASHFLGVLSLQPKKVERSAVLIKN